jgi:hypothetical protein
MAMRMVSFHGAAQHSESLAHHKDTFFAGLVAALGFSSAM